MGDGNGIKRWAEWSDRGTKIAKGLGVMVVMVVGLETFILARLDSRYASAQSVALASGTMVTHTMLDAHPGVQQLVEAAILPMVNASEAAQRTASAAAGQANSAKKTARAAQETAAFGLCKQSGGWVQSLDVPVVQVVNGVEVQKSRIVRACTFFDADGTKESAALTNTDALLLMIQSREARAFARARRKAKRAAAESEP